MLTYAFFGLIYHPSALFNVDEQKTFDWQPLILVTAASRAHQGSVRPIGRYHPRKAGRESFR